MGRFDSGGDIPTYTFFFFKQKTAYEMTCDWSSDVCSSDLETELEQPFHGLRAQAAARILYIDDERGRRLVAQPDGQLLRPLRALTQRMARIAQQVAENLQQLVLIERDAADRVEVAADHDLWAHREMHHQRVLDQLGDIELLDAAAPAGVTLLGGDDLADVLDVRDDRQRFLAELAI